MKITNKIVDHLVTSVMAISAAIVFVITFAQVISRFVFSLSIPWSSDVTRIAFVYSIFFGAACSARDDDHLNLDVVLSLLKPKARRLLQILIYIMITAFLCMVAVYGAAFARGFGGMQRLPYLTWPMAVMYISIPIGAAVMVFYYAQHMFHEIRQLLGKKPRDPDLSASNMAGGKPSGLDVMEKTSSTSDTEGKISSDLDTAGKEREEGEG